MKVERILTNPSLTPPPGGSVSGRIKAQEHDVLTEDAITLDQRKDQKKERNSSHQKYTKNGHTEEPTLPPQGEASLSVDLTA